MFEVHSTLLFSSMIDRLYQSTSRDLTTFFPAGFSRFFSSPNRTKIEKKKAKTKTGDSNIRMLRLNGNTFSSKNLNQKSRKNDEYKVASTLPETAYVNFRHLFFARIAPWVSLFSLPSKWRPPWSVESSLCSLQ